MNLLEEVELDELNELLNADEPIEEVRERFRIKDLSSMNWALRKLSALNKNRGEEVDLANTEIERITVWAARQDIPYQNSKNFLEGLIGEYAKAQRAEDPKWKQKTPFGAVSFRKQQPEWVYEGDKALDYFLTSEWVETCVRVKNELNKAKIKETFKVVGNSLVAIDTGEIVPGVTITDRDPLMTITLEG